MLALPDTGVTASVVMASIMLGVMAVSGAVLYMTVFRDSWWSWWKARHHRREVKSHLDDRFCYFCHGTATRLVKSGYIPGQWQCKDIDLCRKTTEFRRLLDSTRE